MLCCRRMSETVKGGKVRHGSLFSGIGGFDLAASWMGWDNVFQCERDPFCRKALRYYWPETVCYEEIRKFSGEKFKSGVDVLTGGFPCQPFSVAGKRKGTADDRFLWPEMCRIIGEIQPCWIVGENVHGLLNWKRGLVFEQVQADLEAQGYEVWSYVLPAAGVGAPHRRDRVWIIAHADRHRCEQHSEPAQYDDKWIRQGLEKGHEPDTLPGYGDASHTNGQGPSLWLRYGGGGVQNPSTTDKGSKPARNHTTDHWKEFPSESPLCPGNDGLSQRLGGITISKWRNDSIKAAGNAIVPQVALEIFKVIEKMEWRRN